MGDALVASYWCHMCSQMVSPVMEVEIKCPFCESGFVEEMDGRREHEMDLGSDRALSLWTPILLGMTGGGYRRRRLRRESESEEEEEEEEQESLSLMGVSDRERDLEALLRRRRRSSAAVLQLLQGLRAGLLSEQDYSENEREREQEQERVILVNPFNQAIILQGSFNVNQNQNQNQDQNHQAVPGSLGDFLIGPGLDLLLQHLAENDPNRYGSPPAKKEVVEAMPTVKIEENLNCSVCLDDFEIGSEAKEMPCKHKFHDGCILPWLKLHSSCPVCRFQMPAEEGAKVDGDGSRNDGNRVENSDGEVGNGNGRRTWLSILWPFNGLFSLSGSQSGGNSAPNPSSSSSASQSMHQANEN